jgi:hypothetical protein
MFPFQILSFTPRKVLLCLGWTPYSCSFCALPNNSASSTLLHTLSRPLSRPTLWATLAYKPFPLVKTFLPAASILKTIVDPLTQIYVEANCTPVSLHPYYSPPFFIPFCPQFAYCTPVIDLHDIKCNIVFE